MLITITFRKDMLFRGNPVALTYCRELLVAPRASCKRVIEAAEEFLKPRGGVPSGIHSDVNNLNVAGRRCKHVPDYRKRVEGDGTYRRARGVSECQQYDFPAKVTDVQLPAIRGHQGEFGRLSGRIEETCLEGGGRDVDGGRNAGRKQKHRYCKCACRNAWHF